jgi:hypothetical protein
VSTKYQVQRTKWLAPGLRRLVLCTWYVVLGTLFSTLGGSNAALAQDTGNRAGLVLQFPGGTTQTYCIPFDGDSISGLDLLLKTGLPVKVEAYGGLGAEICQIGDTGCNYPDQLCACQSYGPGGVYWSYHHLKSGQWKTSTLGAGSYRVHNGDVEGWAWSDGKPPSSIYTFSQLCPATQPPPAASTTPQAPAPTRPAATVIPPLPTRRPAAPSHTRKPQPTTTPPPAAPPPPSAPTQHPTEQPLPSLTNTPPPTSTPTIQFTPTSTTAPQPTNTAPVPTPTVIRNPQSAIRNEDIARNVGLAIGGIVIVSLAAWGIITAIRRRNTRGDAGVE